MVKIIDIRHRTKRTNGTRKLSQVKNIARHYSATATGNFDTFWRYWNGTRKWGTGGYHEIILRDGSVELCYGPEEITNGVAGLNTSVYNICLVGNGSFTAEQERVFDIRAKAAMKLFKLPVSAVKGHGEFPGSSTSCPGINMDMIRKRLASGAVDTPTSALKRGDTGAFVRQLQADLNKLGYGLVVDGSFGPAVEKAVRDFQTKNKLVADGSYGPLTQVALVAAVAPVATTHPKDDGKNARASASHRDGQDFVKKHGISNGEYPAKNVTREQVWTMLERMDRHIKNK